MDIYTQIYRKVYNKFRLQESEVSIFVENVKKHLLRYVKNQYTYDELRSRLIRIAKDVDSEKGITANNSEVLPKNSRVFSDISIKKVLMYACENLSNEKYYVGELPGC